MIVLVDTSVWIRFLSNRAPHAAELDGLLSRDEASGHDLVYGELLIGDKGGRKQCWRTTSKSIGRQWSLTVTSWHSCATGG
jgi:predicted nucleic acid-binding protein